jgi:DNA-binding transcriptional LysR family regulator
MDLNRLKYFMAVAETGSIRSAAGLLRISPAALSKAIKVLESELGAKLLLPSGRGIILSQKGQEIARRGQAVLDSVRALVEDVNAPASRPCVIGSFEVFTTYFAGPLLGHELRSSPVVLRELIPGELELALASREVDLGITYVPIPHAEVDHLAVTQIEMAIFGLKRFTPTPFEALPFVVPVQPLKGAPTKVQGLDGWNENKLRRKIAYQVTLMETAIELCRQGLAVAYLPKFVARLHNEQVKPEYRLVELEAPRGAGAGRHPVYLALRKSDGESPLSKNLARAIRRICKG